MFSKLPWGRRLLFWRNVFHESSDSRDRRRLAALLPLEDVDDVDLVVGMLPAHVGPHVRRVLRTEGTVRAVESRRLTTRELEMMLKIVAPIEGSTASRAIIHLSAGLPWMLGLMDRSIRAASASGASRSVLASWKMQDVLLISCVNRQLEMRMNDQVLQKNNSPRTKTWGFTK